MRTKDSPRDSAPAEIGAAPKDSSGGSAKAVGDAMRQLRRALGDISQEGLAHQLGVTTRSVCRWEKAKTIPVEALALLRQAAFEAGEMDLVHFFQSAITVKLHFGIEVSDFIPRDIAEMWYASALFGRMRRQDPVCAEVVFQLRKWVDEDQQARKSEEERERQRKARPSLIERLSARRKEREEKR